MIPQAVLDMGDHLMAVHAGETLMIEWRPHPKVGWVVHAINQEGLRVDARWVGREEV